MVASQTISINLVASEGSRYDRPRISDISHEDFASISEDTDTRRPAESNIRKSSADLLLGHRERLLEALVDGVGVWVGRHEVLIFEVYLELVLNDERQSVLQHGTDFPTMLAMAITDREEVAVAQAQKVRRGDVSILIDLVWIVN